MQRARVLSNGSRKSTRPRGGSRCANFSYATTTRSYLSSRLPDGLDRRLADAMAAADVRCPPLAAMQSWGIGVVVAGIVGTIFSPMVALLATAVAIAMGPVGLIAARG